MNVKICGLSTPDTLDAAVAGRASHVGFVFFPPSPRHLSDERAAMLVARVPSHVAKVGVFVDPDDETLARICPLLDAVQLHGVAPSRAAAIRSRFGMETWAALAIRTHGDLAAAADYAGVIDRLLYDAKTPPGAKLPGGMGIRFDWSLLVGFRHPLPWALSGGLDPTTVTDAIARTGAPLVDVSSGVESAPGIKDVDKITAFLKAAYL